MVLRRVLISLTVIAFTVAVVQPVLGAIGAKDGVLRGGVMTDGTLAISSSRTGAILSSTGLKPGQTVNGSITIANTGTLAGRYTLSGAATGSAELAGRLQLVVYKDADGAEGAKLYEGSLGAFRSVELGTFAARGESHTFHFHVSLPTSTSDNALQGLAASASFTWSAVQA